MHLFPGRFPAEIEAGINEGEIEHILDAIRARDAQQALNDTTNHAKAGSITKEQREAAMWLLDRLR